MTTWIDIVLFLLIMTNFLLMGSSRLGMCSRIVAIQGVILGFLPFFSASTVDIHTTMIAMMAIVLKGGVFPWLLVRALREAGVRREVEPFVGYSSSLLIGVAALIVSIWLNSRLGIHAMAGLAAPVSFFTILTGLFLIIARKKALTQVLGYLVLENGIYAFGIMISPNIPFSVELGVLLDVWVGVFAMGVATYHINREFDHTDVDRLNNLKG